MGADGGGPLVHAGSESERGGPTCMRRHMRTTTAGGAQPVGMAAAMRGDNSSAVTTTAAMHGHVRQ